MSAEKPEHTPDSKRLARTFVDALKDAKSAENYSELIEIFDRGLWEEVRRSHESQKETRMLRPTTRSRATSYGKEGKGREEPLPYDRLYKFLSVNAFFLKDKFPFPRTKEDFLARVKEMVDREDYRGLRKYLHDLVVLVDYIVEDKKEKSARRFAEAQIDQKRRDSLSARFKKETVLDGEIGELERQLEQKKRERRALDNEAETETGALQSKKDELARATREEIDADLDAAVKAERKKGQSKG